jgi:branched-chain amino acid aminotransferase
MTRPRFAHFRGRLAAYDETRVGLLTHALNYGTGVFAGLRAYWSESGQQLFVFRPRDHFRRLRESARLLRMELALDEEAFSTALVELLRAEGHRTDCYIRGLAFYGDEVIGIRLHGLHAELALVAVPFGRYIEKADGAHLGTSSWRRVDDNTIPPRGKITGAYANSAFIKSDAELAGFDEALVLNQQGQVSEGSAENFFMLRGGVVVTPPTSASILEGITRRSVLALLGEELGVAVCERPIDRTEVYLADEVFLTGTAAEVTAVTRIDHRPIGDGRMGALTARLRQLFAEVVRGGVPRYREWCLPVYATRSERMAGAAEAAPREERVSV